MASTDNEIIVRILAGEARAFALLVERHKERGMGLAYRMLKSREDAEEALQDAFVRAFRSLGNFEGKSSFSTWLYRIVFNVCATRLSRRGEFLQSTFDDAGEKVEELSSPDPLPDVSFTSQESDSLIREEIQRLPEVFGTTFFLYAVQEKTYDEIAEITGVPLGTVKARLFRARAMLRASVGKRLEIADSGQQQKGAAA